MKSIELQWLEVLNDRCYLNNRMKSRLTKARLGYEGERDFEEISAPYLSKDWVLLHDLTFKKASRHLQLDYVLITPHGIYLFEIKNFTARYEMKNNKLVSEYGNEFRNIFYQIERGEEFLRDLVTWKVPIKGRIIFMAEQDMVSIDEDVHVDDYLKRWQLESFFKQLRENDDLIINVKKTADLILSHTVPSHEGLEFEGSNWVDRVRKGIICEHCKSGQWQRNTRFHIQCLKCGHIEGQKRAILRTIHDYEILHYKSDIELPGLVEFFQGSIPYFNIRKNFREFKKENKIDSLSETYLNKKFRYNSSSCTCQVCKKLL